MAQEYLLHLPDGTEYGPVDRATLESWAREGRLPAETLVWPEGAPEWVSLAAALAAPEASPAPTAESAAASAVRPAKPVVPGPVEERPETLPSMRMPAFEGRAPREPKRPAPPSPAAAGLPRGLVLSLVGVALVLAVLAGVWALLRPFLEQRRAVAEVQRHALPDRRVENAEAGLVVELPPGWVALVPENPFVSRPGALVRVSQPKSRVFGAVTAAARPRLMDDLDGYLDELLRERLPRVPSQREGERSDVQLGKGQGRMVRTTWEDGLVPMQGAIVAWADGYELFALEAWAPASAGDAFAAELDALCRGTLPRGQTAARVDEAVERLAVEVPELSKDALRLLVAERLSQGRGLEDVPSDALRSVSRGLDALAAREAAEMRTIYQQVWAPVPEAERVRLAALLGEIKAGRPVRSEDVAALRAVVQAGVLSLPPEQRSRLQELSDRAVRKSILLP